MNTLINKAPRADRIMKSGGTALFVGALILLASGCGKNESAEVIPTKDTVVVNGSSTVFPISKEAARRFMGDQSESRVAVNFAGTTEGFRQFAEGTLDIGNASRPINEEERVLCESNGVRFAELVLARDAVALVTHPKNKWLQSLSMDDLRKIWSPESEGTVMRWNDVRPEWPDEPIVLFGRGEDSGTMDYFTKTVNGTARAIRGDYFGSEDEELLADKIANNPNALGFFGLGAYHRNWDRLKLLSLDSGNGPVYPTLATVADRTYGPLIRPLYLYLNLESAETKPATLPFLKHYYGHLREWLHFTGYFPLSEQDYAEITTKLESF